MTTSDEILKLAKLGVPIATLGAVYGYGFGKKKKKNGLKRIVGSGASAIVGTSFTKAVYS